MTLLLDAAALARRRIAVQSGLAPLAASLRADLRRVIDAGIVIPTRKALLSRTGGRCEVHGCALEFDPFAPHEHRCPVGRELHQGERHDLWWTTFYQLWLAERAVHAAALHALCGDIAAGALARRILEGYAEQYLRYPNQDNVLGPTRPFFSTYLESIWLLQLCVALDLLESSGERGALGETVRDRILQPSLHLITSFDEHLSNRQVWNTAAILAASTMLGERDAARNAITSPSGLLALLADALLPDGTWYEGENYHFFAHRGLWYAVVMAEQLGAEIPSALRERFEAAFASPLLTALPDFTFPARRDSQYGVSLRQWRFAESCELGLARRDDARLRGALWELYEHSPVVHRDTGRWRSTAESERNEPASALSRADLGWRSLLFARESLPPLAPAPLKSALLESQGIAVLRRDGGRIYTALDYGHSGGGHGHPDRLNLLIAVGSERWLDDVGTGSYVDPTLFWYRSTLAHNAPLIDGRSQSRVNGILRAWDERGAVGWVDAAVPRSGIAPGVSVRRSLVMMPDYLVDRLEWSADRVVSFALPLHIDAELAERVPLHAASFDASTAREDGFSFITRASAASVDAAMLVRLMQGGAVRAWATVSRAARWWRLRGPGAPGGKAADFVLVSARAADGVVQVVWDFGAGIRHVNATNDTLVVETTRGERHEHAVRGAQWYIALESAGARSSITLDGSRASPSASPPESSLRAHSTPVMVPRAPDAPLHFDLGADAYRPSELSWAEAGRPAAAVRLSVDDAHLIIAVDVRKSPLVFRAANAPDPELDNEHPDIHSDGAQFYLAGAHWSTPAGWLAVPAPEGTVRMHVVENMRGDIPCVGSWARSAAGYAMRFAIPLAALGDLAGETFGIEVVVNDMAPDRTRRRGQLVLSGARGETTYLRGDREDAARFFRIRLPDV